jgi:hypothetical protein
MQLLTNRRCPALSKLRRLCMCGHRGREYYLEGRISTFDLFVLAGSDQLLFLLILYLYFLRNNLS